MKLKTGQTYFKNLAMCGVDTVRQDFESMFAHFYNNMHERVKGTLMQI